MKKITIKTNTVSDVMYERSAFIAVIKFVRIYKEFINASDINEIIIEEI